MKEYNTNTTGCSTIQTGTFTVASPNPPTTPTQKTITQPTCTAQTGSITINPSTIGAGNTGTVSYALDGGSAQSSTTFSGIAGGTHTIVAINGECTSSPLTFTMNYPTYVWAGTTSSNPTVGSNWVGGVAPAFKGAESISIPTVSSPAVYPVLTANESVFNLTIGGSPANLNLNGFTLNVGCNIINSTGGGVLTYGSSLNSTINWNGTTAQSYTGNATAGTAALGIMTINNSAGSTVTLQSGPVDIYNQLTLTKGNLVVSTVANTLLTLKSNASQTANVNAITSGYSITGSVNVERYLTGNNNVNYRGYRLLSSPVYVGTANGSNYLSLKYINQVVGNNMGAFTGGPSNYATGNYASSFSISNPFPTIYVYDESLKTSNATYTSGKNIGIVGIDQQAGRFDVKILQGTVANAANIPVGNGYILYFVGPTGTTAGATPKTAPPSTTMTATGTLNQGPVPVKLWKNNSATLSYTAGSDASGVDGLNMVGNPYASTISLLQLYNDNTTGSNSNNKIGANFYELKEPNMTYIAYNAVTGNTSTGQVGDAIVSGQGFLVQAQPVTSPATTSLTFQEDQKITTQLVANGSTTTPQLLLSLKPTLANAGAGLHLKLTKDSVVNTQTGIYFSNSYSDAYNSSEDAIDLDGIAPQVYLSSFSTDGKRLGINSMGDYIKGKHVQLYVKATATGTYQLGLQDIINIDSIFNVYLVDKLLKDSVDLRKTKAYSFNISTTDSTTFGANRFELAIDLGSLPAYKLLSFTGQPVSAGAQLTWKTVNESSYTGFVLQKQLSNNTFAALDSLQSDGSGAYSFVDNNPSKGLNTYRLKQYGVTGAITYSTLVYVDYDATSVFSVYPNPAKGPVNISVNLKPNSYDLSIYNAMGGLVKRLPLTGSNWTEDLSGYTTGTYIFEMNDSKGNFIGKTKVVKVQ